MHAIDQCEAQVIRALEGTYPLAVAIRINNGSRGYIYADLHLHKERGKQAIIIFEGRI